MVDYSIELSTTLQKIWGNSKLIIKQYGKFKTKESNVK